MIHQIAAGLADAMRDVRGLRVSAFPLASVASTPAAEVQLAGIEYHVSSGSMMGFTRITWDVIVTVGRLSDRATVTRMEALLDPAGTRYNSIPVAIETDRTLDGSCASAHVASLSAIGATSVDESMLVARLSVVTYAQAD